MAAKLTVHTLIAQGKADLLSDVAIPVTFANPRHLLVVMALKDQGQLVSYRDDAPQDTRPVRIYYAATAAAVLKLKKYKVPTFDLKGLVL